MAVSVFVSSTHLRAPPVRADCPTSNVNLRDKPFAYESVCPQSECRGTQNDLRSEIVTLLPSLRARAIKLCFDPHEAEDIVQDTIERALRFEFSYEPGTNLRAWAQQILFSVFVTRCRRRRRERRALDSLTHDPCAWTRPEPPPSMRELPRGVEEALAALPAQFAAAIRLVDIGEQSYKDAAETLGVPVGTVMSRLFRGRRLLARALGGPELPSEDAVPARAA